MEKKDHDISHKRKTEMLEMSWCRNKCFSKRNLNSCNVDDSLTFNFGIYAELCFRTNSTLFLIWRVFLLSAF